MFFAELSDPDFNIRVFPCDAEPQMSVEISIFSLAVDGEA